MGRYSLKYPQGISILFAISVTLIAIKVNAGGNNTQDNLSIKIETSRIRNLINNSIDSTAKVKVGSIKQNRISGGAQIAVKVNNVGNRIGSGNKNSSRINLATIEDSEINNANIDVDINSVSNSVKGAQTTTWSPILAQLAILLVMEALV